MGITNYADFNFSFSSHTMINRLTTEYVTEYEEVSPRFDLIENVGRHAVNPRGDFTIIVNMWRTSYIVYQQSACCQGFTLVQTHL